MSNILIQLRPNKLKIIEVWELDMGNWSLGWEWTIGRKSDEVVVVERKKINNNKKI
jgi:hypothetical protein